MKNDQLQLGALGVTTFGSWVVSAAADIVLIDLSVEVVELSANKAFSSLKKKSQSVRKTLDRLKNIEVNSSQVTLNEKWDGRTQKHTGYRASVSYSIKLKDISKMERVITSAIDAGANRIRSVKFQTSELRKHRAEARRLAVIAARDKAQVYCDAAGVKLGKVLNIEDLNPDSLKKRGYGRESSDWMSGSGGDDNSMNPGDLQISGAVKLTYSLVNSE